MSLTYQKTVQTLAFPAVAAIPDKDDWFWSALDGHCLIP